MEYRIKKITYGAGYIEYIAEYKNWFSWRGWSPFKYNDGYVSWIKKFNSLEEAQREIDEDIYWRATTKMHKKKTIEIIKYP